MQLLPTTPPAQLSRDGSDLNLELTRHPLIADKAL